MRMNLSLAKAIQAVPLYHCHVFFTKASHIGLTVFGPNLCPLHLREEQHCLVFVMVNNSDFFCC